MLSNTYIVEEAKHCFVVDPCKMEQVEELIKEKKLTIDFCFLTHEHFDHISGLDWIHNQKIPVIATVACDKGLKDSKVNQSRYYDAFSRIQVRLKDCKPVHVDEYIGYADECFDGIKEMQWQGHNLLFKETPGHSRGSACMLVDNGILFSGDTLLGDTYTGTNMLSGSKKQLDEISMPWLSGLPFETLVYAGHGEEFVLGERLLIKFEKPRRKND